MEVELTAEQIEQANKHKL